MIESELLPIIKKMLDEGKDSKYILKTLIEKDYTEKNIQDSLDFLVASEDNNQKTLIYKNKYIVGTIIFVAILLVILTMIKSNDVSKNELLQGTQIELNENENVILKQNNEKYEVTLTHKYNNSVKLLVDKQPVELTKGKTATIDYDSDGSYDITIEYISSLDDSNLFFIKQSESSCQAEWECSDWSRCSFEKQTRECSAIKSCIPELNKPLEEKSCLQDCVQDWVCTTWSECDGEAQSRSCTDVNSCGSNENKPAIIQTCEIGVCLTNWACGSWSECFDGKQSRGCNDLNNCNTNTDKPILTQNCESCVENWQCSDWSVCSSNIQSRTCTDSNSCGSNENKPDLTKSCEPLGDLIFSGPGQIVSISGGEYYNCYQPPGLKLSVTNTFNEEISLGHYKSYFDDVLVSDMSMDAVAPGETEIITYVKTDSFDTYRIEFDCYSQESNCENNIVSGNLHFEKITCE